MHYFEPIDSRLINQARKIVYIIDDNLFKKNYFVENSDKILFIGHGYGQNSENLSIDNNLKSAIESYSVTNNSKNIVFLGDFLTTSKNENWRDFNKQISNLEKGFLVLGNHEYSLTSYIRLFFNFQSSYFKIVDDKNNVFYFLNTIRKWFDIDQKQYEFILTDLNENNYDNIFFLSHHLLWSSIIEEEVSFNNGSKKSNIKKFNKNFLDLHNYLNTLENEIYFISGDMGRYIPYFEKKVGKINYYSIGYGKNELYKERYNEEQNFGYGLILNIKNDGIYFNKLEL